MNYHKLKILQEHYNNVRSGTKTFEIRVNDRAFQKGDTVCLQLYFKHCNKIIVDQEYPELIFRVGDVYLIDAERVVFSLLSVDTSR